MRGVFAVSIENKLKDELISCNNYAMIGRIELIKYEYNEIKNDETIMRDFIKKSEKFKRYTLKENKMDWNDTEKYPYIIHLYPYLK